MSAAAAYFAYVAQNRLLPVYLPWCNCRWLELSQRQHGGGTFNRTAAIIVFRFGCFFVVTRLLAFNITTFFIVVMVARFLGVLTAVMVALYTDTAVCSEWKTGENASPFIMGLMNISKNRRYFAVL